MPKRPVPSIEEFLDKNPEFRERFLRNSDQLLIKWVIERCFDDGFSMGYEKGFMEGIQKHGSI